MKQKTDFKQGETFTTIRGHEYKVEMTNATPAQAGVPKDCRKDAAAGCSVYFGGGKVYTEGTLLVTVNKK